MRQKRAVNGSDVEFPPRVANVVRRLAVQNVIANGAGSADQKRKLRKSRSDAGIITAIVTPGGHRRYREADVEALLHPSAPPELPTRAQAARTTAPLPDAAGN